MVGRENVKENYVMLNLLKENEKENLNKTLLINYQHLKPLFHSLLTTSTTPLHWILKVDASKESIPLILFITVGNYLLENLGRNVKKK